MDAISISQFRANLPKLIDEVSDYMKRIVITVTGKPKAVVISQEELESLEETAEILSTPKALTKIKKGLKQAKLKKGILLKNFNL